MYQANLKQNLDQSNSFNLMILFYHKKKMVLIETSENLHVRYN